jgi:hypothetical protein
MKPFITGDPTNCEVTTDFERKRKARIEAGNELERLILGCLANGKEKEAMLRALDLFQLRFGERLAFGIDAAERVHSKFPKEAEKEAYGCFNETTRGWCFLDNGGFRGSLVDCENAVLSFKQEHPSNTFKQEHPSNTYSVQKHSEACQTAWSSCCDPQ